MAKIKCVHCGKLIDDQCKVCIYCKRKVGTLPDEVLEKRYQKIEAFVVKIIIIILFIAIVATIGYEIIMNIQQRKEMETLIKNTCSTTKYANKELKEIIKDSDCPSFVYYVKKKSLTDETINEIISAGNEEIYKIYYKLENKEIYESYKNTPNVLPKEYLEYLLNNDKKLSYEYADISLITAVINEDEETFELLCKLVEFPDSYHSKIESYLNGVSKFEDLDITFPEKDFNELQKLANYTLKYHQLLDSKSCLESDLTTKENLEYLIKENDGTICEYEFYAERRTLSNEDFKRYYELGGIFNKYDGEFYKYLMDYASYEEIEQTVPVYVSIGMDINAKYDINSKSDATVLDYIIDKGHSDCASYKNGWGDIDPSYTEKCLAYQQKYKLLKKYGAKCVTECDDEKWLR